MHPIGCFRQKWLWLIRYRWFVVGQVGQFDRQPRIRDGVTISFGVKHHGEGFTPVTLAGEQPVSQSVGHPAFTAVVLHQPINHLGFGLGGTQAVQTQGFTGAVDGKTVFGKAAFGF